MNYKKYMEQFTVSEITKDRIYTNIISKKEKKMKYARFSKGFAFVFIGIFLFLAAGMGIWYAITNSTDQTLQKRQSSYILAFSCVYDKSRIPFRVDDFDENGEIAQSVGSLSELQSFSAEKGFPFFDETDENYSADLSKKIREYDDVFFKNNSLVLLFKLSDKYDLSRFDDLRVESGIMTITLNKPEEEGTLSDLYAFVYLIETTKTLSERVLEIRTETLQNGNRVDYFGQLYSGFDELYSSGEITLDDIKSVSYYCGKDVDVCGETITVEPNYIPKEKNPESLSEETLILIYMSYVDLIAEEWKRIANPSNNPKIDEMLEKEIKTMLEIITIDDYYGTYNGYVAINLTIDLSKSGGLSLAVISSYSQSLVMFWKGHEQ